MARTRALDPISIGANLQSEKYRNKTALPNEHDMDAQLFGEIGKAVGDKPRGWGALVSGLAKGAEYGAKTKSVAKRKEDYDKYEKVMDYLGEVNNAAIERKQWYETREMARQQFLPQVLSYADNIDRLDPQSQRIMAQNILDGYSRATGDDLKLVSIDGSDPFMVTVQTPKGAQILDVRTLFAGDELLQQKMAMKMPEYQMKLQQEREDKKKQFELKEQELKGKYGGQLPAGQEDNYGSIPLSSMKGRGTTSLINTVNAEMNLAKEAPVILGMLDEAQQIIQQHPKIGSSWANLVGGSDTGRSLLGKEDREAYEKLNKIANRIAESYIKAKGSAITESERETIKKGLFDVSLSSGANQYNINSVRKELNLSKLRGDFAAKELSRGYISTSESFNNYLQENPQLVEGSSNRTIGNKVTIFDPESGERVQIYEKDLDQAINNGWELQQ